MEGGEIYCYPDSYKPGTLDKYEDCYTKNNVIGNCMFRKCKSLKKVLLPYSCVKIENESFAYYIIHTSHFPNQPDIRSVNITFKDNFFNL